MPGSAGLVSKMHKHSDLPIRVRRRTGSVRIGTCDRVFPPLELSSPRFCLGSASGMVYRQGQASIWIYDCWRCSGLDWICNFAVPASSPNRGKVHGLFLYHHWRIHDATGDLGLAEQCESCIRFSIFEKQLTKLKNMGGHYKRSIATAMQIGFGNAGGIVASNVFITNQSPRYPVGYGVSLAMLLMCGVMCTVFYFGLKAENRKRDLGGRDYRFAEERDELNNMGDDHPGFRYTL